MPTGDAIAVNPTTGDLMYDSDISSGSAGGTQTIQTLTVSAATLANVASSASSVTIFASNASARGRMVYNDSTQILYLKYGSGAATTSSYTVQLAASAYFEFPSPCYTGAVTGIWASANGNARTTEV